MAKMTVIYKTPKDISSFEKHYYEVHIPLAKKLPGLIKYEVSNGAVRSTTGHSDVYLMANLYFDSFEAMMESFKSDIGQQCAADRRILASDDEVQIYVYDVKNT
ncbi:EthD family reductase [Flavobacterium sp. KACC 22763]|uniref:EthD family reductase n=1 Tax=Flavobacterium sp. KACC 22763 TaxID=3025668 RepID=UPI00236517D2|nr:EthD family reductase [Flavobacterium sp. KACC 22763]WDF65934.1 EthD family reductase [Flavobacterium sp. KACC 22763]